MRLVRRSFRVVWPLVAVGLAGCSAGGSAEEASEERPTLVIYAAASLGEALENAGALYQAREPVELVYNFASSGALAQQLLAAPRADLYLSASEQWMSELEQAGLVEGGGESAFLSNRLSIVAHPESNYKLQSAERLCHLPFRYLAVGDPEVAPVGGYARDYLSSIECSSDQSVWDALRGRLSPAPDAPAALAQVAGNRDVVAIVYRTDALARAAEVRTLWEVEPAKGPDIRYPVAVLRGAESPEAARGFLAFLRGSEARAVFEAAGFAVLTETGPRGKE